jgi:hypothetical protein
LIHINLFLYEGDQQKWCKINKSGKNITLSHKPIQLCIISNPLVFFYPELLSHKPIKSKTATCSTQNFLQSFNNRKRQLVLKPANNDDIKLVKKKKGQIWSWESRGKKFMSWTTLVKNFLLHFAHTMWKKKRRFGYIAKKKTHINLSH